MALGATDVIEVRTDGHFDNGGGFLTGGGGTDYSQQASPQVTFDGGATTASNSGASATIDLTGLSGAAAHVGNYLKITGGTNFTTGWYRIVSQTGTTWTLDRTCTTAAGSAMTGRMGGALNGPGALGKLLSDHGVSGMLAWVKSGTYTINSNTYNVTGGKFSLTTGIKPSIIGYHATRGDLNFSFGTSNRPLFDITVSGTNRGMNFTNSGTQCGVIIANIIIDATSASPSKPAELIDGGNNDATTAVNMILRNGAVGAKSVHLKHSDVHGMSSYGTAGKATSCRFYNNGSHGVMPDTFGLSYTNILCYDNTGDGINCAERGCDFTNITCVGNGGDGIELGAVDNITIANFVATHNTGYGLRFGSGRVIVYNWWTFSNTAGSSTGTLTYGTTATALTGDPWVNRAGDDYTPNSTAGAGAELRGAFSGYQTQSSYHDGGAVQHQDAGGTVYVPINKPYRLSNCRPYIAVRQRPLPFMQGVITNTIIPSTRYKTVPRHHTLTRTKILPVIQTVENNKIIPSVRNRTIFHHTKSTLNHPIPIQTTVESIMPFPVRRTRIISANRPYPVRRVGSISTTVNNLQNIVISRPVVIR